MVGLSGGDLIGILIGAKRPSGPLVHKITVHPAHLQVCWERSVETLTAMEEDIAGLAIASDERIEALSATSPLLSVGR